MSMTEICADIRNFFPPVMKKTDKSFIHIGSFTISGKTVTPLDFIAEGQYFRIVGSAKNDGVWLNTTQGLSQLSDETFYGSIWEMSVPRDFVNLCEDIEAWRQTYEASDSANLSPYSAESFAGYSYTKATANGSQNASTALSWQSQFASRLNAYRRLNSV